jgi:hypothetical protein
MQEDRNVRRRTGVGSNEEQEMFEDEDAQAALPDDDEENEEAHEGVLDSDSSTNARSIY